MKTRVLIALAVCGLASSVRAGPVSGSASRPSEAFFGPTRAWTVTINSSEGVVSVLQVPKGVVVGISGTYELMSPFADTTAVGYEFGGDLTIKLRHIGDPGSHVNQPMSACLVDAPVELRIGQANVIVTAGEK